ncbi:MAG: amidohydrolase [Bacillota bacterium]|nr:amidohydrolase [Bacillota bacterium]
MRMHQLLQRSWALQPRLVELRRTLHQYPELGYEEVNTARRISEYLRQVGLDVALPAGTAVVGILRGKERGRVVVLRSDMDALAVDEVPGREYGSRVPGVMHACGHDGHMAMLVGAAILLGELRDFLRGEVRFVFQPAEEKLPDGGARALVGAGVLDDPPADLALGYHVWPDLAVGKVGVHPGAVMAAADLFRVTFSGRGGHGALPHRAADAVLAACHSVVALDSVVSRNVDAIAPAVLSVGMVRGGESPNVIPEEVTLAGTTRYFDGALGDLLRRRIGEVATGVGRVYRCRAQVEYQQGYPAVVNDPAAADLVASAAAAVLGEQGVCRNLPPAMVSEDFSCFAQRVPSCYFWLGTQNKRKGTHRPLHSPDFDLDEEVLAVGAAILAQVCVEFLG